MKNNLRKLTAASLALLMAAGTGMSMKATLTNDGTGDGNNTEEKTCPPNEEYVNEYGCTCKYGYVRLDGVCVKETSILPEEPEPDRPVFGNVFKMLPDMTIPEINAGESKEIIFPIVYAQSAYTNKEQATITLPDGLYFYKTNEIQDLDMKRQDNEFEYKDKIGFLKAAISADSSLKSGIYPVTIKLTFKYSDNQEPKEETVNAYVKVNGTNGDAKANVQIARYAFDKENIMAGDAFNLMLDVTNRSSSELKNVVVSLGGLSASGIALNNALDHMPIGNIKANSTQTVTFPLIASKNISGGAQMLELNVTADGLDAPLSSNIFAYVSKGTNAETGLLGIPKIVIDSYDYGGTSVTGGTPFNLSFSFRNTSSAVTIRDLKLTVQSVALGGDDDTGGAFTPTSTSNSFFIKSMAPNSIVTEEIELMPRADAKPKSYGIEIRYEGICEIDGELREVNSTETIAIPLTQPDRFEIGEIESWGMMYVGMESEIFVTYVNKGKTTINNLEISVEGENMTPTENGSYVGNVESGSSDSYSVSIIPNGPGPVNGKLIFTYEDANGQTVETVKEFVYDAMEMQMGPMEPEMPIGPVEEEKGLPTWGKVVLGAVVAGGLGAVGFVVFKKRKAAKAKKVAETETYDDFPEDGE